MGRAATRYSENPIIVLRRLDSNGTFTFFHIKLIHDTFPIFVSNACTHLHGEMHSVRAGELSSIDDLMQYPQAEPLSVSCIFYKNNIKVLQDARWDSCKVWGKIESVGGGLNKEEGSMDGRGVPENQKVKLHQEIRRNPCLGERFSFFLFRTFFRPVSLSLSECNT